MCEEWRRVNAMVDEEVKVCNLVAYAVLKQLLPSAMTDNEADLARLIGRVE